MTDGEQERPDEVGNVAEEAAKLLEALQGWAQGSGGVAAAAAAAGLGDRLGEVGEHLATGGKACTYCPVCRVIAMLRETSPEARAHLMVAGSSLLQAAAALLESRAPRPPGPSGPGPGDPGLERIHLDEPAADDGWTAE
jgi:hypothetical protein